MSVFSMQNQIDQLIHLIELINVMRNQIDHNMFKLSAGFIILHCFNLKKEKKH